MWNEFIYSKRKEIRKMKPKKCRYWKKCKLYDPTNKTCNEDEGFYGSGYPGCYRRMMEEEK